MKLNIEIKNDRFIYSYKIGTSEHNSSSPLCADSLVVFSRMVETCHGTSKFQADEKHRDMQKKAMDLYDKCIRSEQNEN